MTLDDRVHALRVHLFRQAGFSRSGYHQLWARSRRYGAEGLHPKFGKARPGRPPQLDATVERQVVDLSLS